MKVHKVTEEPESPQTYYCSFTHLHWSSRSIGQFHVHLTYQDQNITLPLLVVKGYGSQLNWKYSLMLTKTFAKNTQFSAPTKMLKKQDTNTRNLMVLLQR